MNISNWSLYFFNHLPSIWCR